MQNTRAALLLVAMLASVPLAGCAETTPDPGGDRPDDRDGADGGEAPDGADGVPSPSAQRVLFVRGTTETADANTTGRSFARGAYDPGAGTVYLLLGGDEAPEDEDLHQAGRIADTYPAVDLAGLADSDTRDAMDALARNRSGPDDVAYHWFAAVLGEPVWTTVVVGTGEHAHVAAYTVDPETREVTGDDPAVFPIAASSAIFVARQVASSWADDAAVVEAWGVEVRGGFARVGFDHDPPGLAIVPVDVIGGNGQAPLWVVRLHSAASDAFVDVVVQGSGDIAELDPVPAGGAYGDGTVPADVLDSVEAADAAFGGDAADDRGAAEYHLHVREGRAVWTVRRASGDAILQWTVDATSGEVVSGP